MDADGMKAGEGETRGEGGAADYAWGEPDGGLQLGLKASCAAVGVGGHVDLSAAARNLSAHPVAVGNDFRLLIRGPADSSEDASGESFEDASGPRSGTPLRLEPGELLEAVSWRVGEQINRRPGAYTFSVTYRPEEGRELRSGQRTVEVRGAPDADETSAVRPNGKR